jgi:HPt (histidine-containing phosphotransfer) domain-containing protein
VGPLPETGREENLVSDGQDIVDWVHFERSRSELGPGFIRILGYFREDGVKSVGQIEQAMREQNTAALVIPAHTLKGESRQLGAEPLAKVAELIESTARFCVESHRFPDELVPKVVELRRLFEQTVEQFDKATNPLMARSRPGAAGFGRKASNQDFGRI